jgi:hypothetical protein
VVWDPETTQWVMLYVTIPDPDSTVAHVPHTGTYDPNRMVVGLGRAPMAFASDADWTDLEALWITDAAYPNGTGMTTWESPHAFSRTFLGETLWFLFASTGPGNEVQGVSFMTGPSLTLSRFEKKGRTGWTWRGPIADLQIVDSYGRSNLSTGWFATEYMNDPETGLEYFANVHFPYLEFRRLRWRTTSFGFDLETPFAIQELDPQQDVVIPGQPVDLIVRAVSAHDGTGPKTRALAVVTVNQVGDSVGVVTPAQVGLPDSVTVIEDETHVIWYPRIVDVSPLRIRVQLAAPYSDVQSRIVTVWSGTSRLRPGTSHSGARQPVLEIERTSLEVIGSPSRRPSLAFRLGEPSVARLTLFDLRGRVVRRLLDRQLPSGPYRVAWDAAGDEGEGLPAGIYFARLETERGSWSARMVLLGR